MEKFITNIRQVNSSLKNKNKQISLINSEKMKDTDQGIFKFDYTLIGSVF